MHCKRAQKFSIEKYENSMFMWNNLYSKLRKKNICLSSHLELHFILQLKIHNVCVLEQYYKSKIEEFKRKIIKKKKTLREISNTHEVKRQ